MNKSRLSEAIRTGYILFKTLVAEFDETAMLQPGAIGEWSVKDTVAHIVVHAQRMLQWMNEKVRGKQPVMDQPYGMQEAELSMLNEQIYQEYRNRPLDDILYQLDLTHAEVLEFVKAANEEDLVDPFRFSLHNGEPLWEAIAANTFWHYEEHAQDLRRWQTAAIHQTIQP